MQDDKYMNLAISIFAELQRKNNLKLVAKSTVLNYSNNTYNFSVYLEKHFEFYVCFHLNNEDLRLYDIAVWLGFGDNDIDLLSRNQFANEQDAIFVLNNLQNIMEKLLVELQRRPTVLGEFVEHQRNDSESRLLETNISSIRQAWEAREYEKFLKLVDLNRTAIKQSKRGMLIFKQEAYLKKLEGTCGRQGAVLREPF